MCFVSFLILNTKFLNQKRLDNCLFFVSELIRIFMAQMQLFGSYYTLPALRAVTIDIFKIGQMKTNHDILNAI